MPTVDSFIFILYVADQQRSTAFYKTVFGAEPVLNVPGMTEFRVTENVRLGLMPEIGIAKIVCPVMPHPGQATGVPRCEAYFRVKSPERFLDRSIEAGAVLVSELSLRDWGDIAGYVADPDGHVLAFASKQNVDNISSSSVNN